MGQVVADTHAAVWHLFGSSRLSTAARAAFEQTTLAGDSILVPTISIVEVCYLVEKGQFQIGILRRLLQELSTPGSLLVAVALDLDIVRAVEQIPRHLVPEMPGRVVAATALQRGLPLVTSDLRIRATTNVTTIW